MIHLTLLPAAALLALVAQDTPQRPDRNADVTRAQVIERVDQRFARLDANNDGRFTREEGQAMHQRRRTEMGDRIFDRLDADRNGSISREEMNQAREQRQARRGERMGGRRGMHGRRAMRMHRVRGAMAMRMLGEQGVITREQFRQQALQRFDRVDADRNGTLTAAERRAARPHRGMRMRRGPGAPPPPGAGGDF